MSNLNEKFMKELSKIKDPVIFLGLCPILKVDIYMEEKDENGNPQPKNFTVLFKEIMDNYNSAGRKRKRELLKILREANKTKEGDFNGSRAKDTEVSIQN